MANAEFLRQTFALDGRIALITGASSGLGAHIATTLARAGCKVVLAARRKHKLELLATEITAQIDGTGEHVMSVVMDVNNRQSVESAIAQIVTRFARIDILVNNAGIAESQRFIEMTEVAWQKVVDTNLSAVWRVGQVVAQQMLAQKSGGAIINIASMLGVRPQYSQANYSAAKAGVIQLTKTMALELARKGVRVNALAPGYFATEMNQKFLNSARGQSYIAALLPQRCGKLAELDGAVLLLASAAASYINGSILNLDGGALLGNI